MVVYFPSYFLFPPFNLKKNAKIFTLEVEHSVFFFALTCLPKIWLDSHHTWSKVIHGVPCGWIASFSFSSKSVTLLTQIKMKVGDQQPCGSVFF
jgi:hypothetical protein